MLVNDHQQLIYYVYLETHDFSNNMQELFHDRAIISPTNEQVGKIGAPKIHCRNPSQLLSRYSTREEVVHFLTEFLNYSHSSCIPPQKHFKVRRSHYIDAKSKSTQIIQ